MFYVGLKEYLKLGYVKLGLLELDVSWKKNCIFLICLFILNI